MIKRTGLIKFRNKEVTIVGPDLIIGDQAPEFSARNLEWEEIKILKATSGKVRLIAAVPSLDTDVCDRETRRFNLEATALSKEIVIITISMDTPWTQKRWCGASGVDQVMVVSDHPRGDFGKKYGALMEEFGILRRSVFVINPKGIVTYAAYMPAIGVEPNYIEVLNTAKNAI